MLASGGLLPGIDLLVVALVKVNNSCVFIIKNCKNTSFDCFLLKWHNLPYFYKLNALTKWWYFN